MTQDNPDSFISNPQSIPDTEGKLKMLQVLNLHPNWMEVLREGLKVEEAGEKKYKENNYGNYYGWEWYETHTQIQTLHKMVTERLLDITLSTRSGTHFRICQPDLVKEVLKAMEETPNYTPPSLAPNNLFQSIVGYGNIKTLVMYAIGAEKAVHFLFSGPPASAKTLFLMELAKLPESYYCLAATTSQAGLANLLFTFQPKFLLIDEIDRLGGDHIGTLNSLMATGIVSESKFGKTRGMELKTKVFAAGIKIHLLPADLLSRFTHIRFEPYNETEFVEVASAVLVDSESTPTDLAAYIAKEVWNKGRTSSDVRQCVQVARLCGGDASRAKEIFGILKK